VSGVDAFFEQNGWAPLNSGVSPLNFAFDYSLRDPNGNGVCITCPTGFAFMIAGSSSFTPQNGGNYSNLPFGVAPGTGSSQERIVFVFDHATACAANSNANFMMLYRCDTNCTPYTSIGGGGGITTNSPPYVLV
jgi:hypothetical protein